jgi:hypothetical protein
MKNEKYDHFIKLHLMDNQNSAKITITSNIDIKTSDKESKNKEVILYSTDTTLSTVFVNNKKGGINIGHVTGPIYGSIGSNSNNYTIINSVQHTTPNVYHQSMFNTGTMPNAVNVSIINNTDNTNDIENYNDIYGMLSTVYDTTIVENDMDSIAQSRGVVWRTFNPFTDPNVTLQGKYKTSHDTSLILDKTCVLDFSPPIIGFAVSVDDENAVKQTITFKEKQKYVISKSSWLCGVYVRNSLNPITRIEFTGIINDPVTLSNWKILEFSPFIHSTQSIHSSQYINTDVVEQ